jgi:hypothetical protein
MENIQLIEFSKNIKDLLFDLKTSFSDKTEHIINENSDLLNILNYDFEKLNNNESEMDENEEYKSLLISSQKLFDYCKTVYPERFFDILYQNEEVFTNDSNTCFLPQIDFAQLYFDTTSVQTKETLWKYLQLILFSIVTSIDSKDSFGANTQLFEAINSDEFKNKLQDTVKQMEQMFNFKKNTQNTESGNHEKEEKETEEKEDSNEPKLPFDFEKMFESMNLPSTEDMSNALPGNLPDTDSIFSHINGLINGKIGSLAKELAEETTKDLDIDMENVTDVNDVFKKLFKNPGNLMNLVNNISSKLDNKMKDGSIKESELLEEASSIFKNMKNMPGMDNMEQLFKSMNMDQFMPKGGKFNNNAFQHMMDQNVKMSKMKERMRKKQEAKIQPSYSTNYSESKETNSQSNFNPDTKNLNELNNNLASLMEQMQNMSGSGSSTSFINDILKKQSQCQEQGKNDSNGEIKKRKTNNKKKVNKKK